MMLKRTNSEKIFSGILLVIGGLIYSVAAASSSGFKYNNLTLSPFVNLEANYDSNVDLDRHDYHDWYLTVNPGVDLNYQGNDWGLRGNLWFAYDRYMKYTELDDPRYGFSLQEYWESPRGIRAVLGQRFMQSRVNDSIHDGGRGIWRERSYWDINGAVAWQMSEKTGVTLSGQWSETDYKSNSNRYAPLYGWESWSTGLELAHRLTQKSNVLLAGGFQRYSSDGTTDGNSRNSTGYSLMGGVGSRATERITYRLLSGISWFDYADGDRKSYDIGSESDSMIVGWTYSADANWLISRKWAASLAGSSYFQPSETEQNQALMVQTLSTGVIYRPVTRLSLRGDVGFRREEDEFKLRYYDYGKEGWRKSRNTDYIYSLRLRADYQFAKYASVYAGIEFMDRESDTSLRDYDRFFGTLGLKLQY